DDAVDGLDGVSRQSLLQRMDDGNAAAYARLKSNVNALSGRGGEDFFPMKRQHGLVCRDDRFPGGNGIQDQAFGKITAADQFDDDVDGGIGQYLLGVFHEHARRERNSAVPDHVQIRDANELNGHAHAPADQSRIFQQYFDDAGTDRAEAHHADADPRNHSSPPSSFKAFLIPRTAWRVLCSFSTSAKRTYSSPPSPNPMPGETATLASRSSSLENSSEPMCR